MTMFFYFSTSSVSSPFILPLFGTSATITCVSKVLFCLYCCFNNLYFYNNSILPVCQLLFQQFNFIFSIHLPPCPLPKAIFIFISTEKLEKMQTTQHEIFKIPCCVVCIFSIFDRFLILILHHTLSNRFALSPARSPRIFPLILYMFR